MHLLVTAYLMGLYKQTVVVSRVKHCNISGIASNISYDSLQCAVDYGTKLWPYSDYVAVPIRYSTVQYSTVLYIQFEGSKHV